MRPVFLIAAATVVSAQHYDNLDAVLWAQTSVEFQAGVRQVYAAARNALDRALATPHWTAVSFSELDLDKPPAIILDLDETVIDNSPYRAQLLKAGGKPFALDGWNKWVSQANAKLLPGAREFLDYAKMRGVRVYFVTNRDCNPGPSDPTSRNLGALGLDYAKLLCRETTSDKDPRRAVVAASHRVLLLIGDDINDFFTPPATLEGRQQMLDRYAQFFGDRWFLIPNPMYGSWERPFADNVQKKLDALKP